MSEVPKLDFDRIRAKDETALRELFDYILPHIEKLAHWETRRFGLPRMDAEELVHETIYKVYQYLHKFSFDHVDGLLPWCRVIMSNVVRDNMRKMSRMKRECDYFEAESIGNRAAHLNELSELDVSETVASLLACLSAEERDLVQKRIDGKTFAELSKDLEVSQAHLYRRWSAITDKLRQRLESEFGSK